LVDYDIVALSASNSLSGCVFVVVQDASCNLLRLEENRLPLVAGNIGRVGRGRNGILLLRFSLLRGRLLEGIDTVVQVGQNRILISEFLRFGSELAGPSLKFLRVFQVLKEFGGNGDSLLALGRFLIHFGNFLGVGWSGVGGKKLF